MFIIFLKSTNQIISYGSGTPIESVNALYLGSEVICNDLSICGWKYIEDQQLEKNESGFIHDADYYPEVTPVKSLEEQIADIRAALFEMEGI